MAEFFEITRELDKLKRLEQPGGGDLESVRELVGGDAELTRYFYDKNKRGGLSGGWLDLLGGAGEFECLGGTGGEPGVVEQVKALYLADCAADKAEAVLGIIEKIKAKDAAIQGILMDAFAKMPEDVAGKGISVVLDYLEGREYKYWYSVGEGAGKLMVGLVERQPNEAFAIAKRLLDVWRAEDNERSVFNHLRGKFVAHEYKRLMFDYYSKVWEKRPVEAAMLLADMLNGYVEDCSTEKGYDTSEYSRVSIEDLANIERLDYDLEAIIVKGICEGGVDAMKSGGEGVCKLLDYLEGLDKGIFHRIEMYLLRFVEGGEEKERINRTLGDERFLEGYSYRNEYKRLLNDKFDEVDDRVRDLFVGWVNKEKVSGEQRQEIEEWCERNGKPKPDFEKMENGKKAEQLYLVRERFKDLYEEYKRKAGLEDGNLSARKMVGEARAVSPAEGSPLGVEEMVEMGGEEVLRYLGEPTNYEGEMKPGEWRGPKDALEAAFREAIRRRPGEYIGGKVNERLVKLDAGFVSSYFSAIWDLVRSDAWERRYWAAVVKLAARVVEENKDKKGYKYCFREVLSALREGFTAKDKAIEFDREMIRTVWGIFEALVRYEEDYRRLEHERDPMQMRCSSVNGEALEQVVMIGFVCKRKFEEYYEGHLQGEIRKVLDYVVGAVKRAEVNCTLGADLGRIGWLDEEWLKGNLERVFEGKMWDVVWGTHVAWGRPSRSGFDLLLERGIYARAITKLGEANEYNFQKEPEEGFTEHLMIGYFNGWIALDAPLLEEFFNEASAELRGKAARFLTTGFKPEKEGGEDYSEVSDRMRRYWRKRLEVMSENRAENLAEAVEFTGWVEDSLLAAKETLELLEKTLELTEGRLGKMRDARDFIERVCELGEGNELLALKCLKKAAADENMRTPWAMPEGRLVEFLEGMVEMAPKVTAEAVDVADAYGRLHPEKFHAVWEKLSGI